MYTRRHALRGLLAGSALTIALALSACGAGPGRTPPAAAPTAAAREAPTSAAAGSAGIDQTKLDICALLPRDQVEAAIGALTEAPAPSIAVGSEVGCSYTAEQGRGYEITVYNLDRWEIIGQISTSITPLAGLGDGAYRDQEVGGNTALYVLLRDRAVVGARVNGADTPALRKLLDLALARVRAI